jgi:hypothetical protein
MHTKFDIYYYYSQFHRKKKIDFYKKRTKRQNWWEYCLTFFDLRLLITPLLYLQTFLTQFTTHFYLAIIQVGVKQSNKMSTDDEIYLIHFKLYLKILSGGDGETINTYYTN